MTPHHPYLTSRKTQCLHRYYPPTTRPRFATKEQICTATGSSILQLRGRHGCLYFSANRCHQSLLHLVLPSPAGHARLAVRLRTGADDGHRGTTASLTQRAVVCASGRHVRMFASQAPAGCVGEYKCFLVFPCLHFLRLRSVELAVS